MKRVLLQASMVLAALDGRALAADLPAVGKAPPPAATAVYNWTGFYVGGNIGYGWGQTSDPFVTFSDPGDFIGFANYFAAGGNAFPALKPKGVIGGAQAGYNWQVNSLVLGAVADFQGTDIQAFPGVIALPPRGPASTESQSLRLDMLGTLRHKAGIAIDNVTIYGTGGIAYGRVKSTLSFESALAGVAATGSREEWRAGWTAGVGGEYGIGPWSFGVEYLHYDLGRTSVTAAVVLPTGSSATLTSDPQRVAGDILRATFNYRFGDAHGALVARY